MSDLRYRGRTERSDAQQSGFLSFGKADYKAGEPIRQEQTTNILQGRRKSAAAMIWARMLCAVWWFFTLATSCWPVCIHQLLGGSLLEFRIVAPVCLLLFHWNIRSSKGGSKSAGKSTKTSLVSSLVTTFKQAAAPLLAFYITPYKWLILLSTIAYALYSSSLLLLPFPDLGQRVWFVVLTVTINSSLLALIAMELTGTCTNASSAGLCRERGCIGVDLTVTMVACVCASVLQGAARCPVTSFHFPALQVGRWRRLMQLTPTIVERALMLSVQGVTAALCLVWVVASSASGELAVQIQGLVLCGVAIPVPVQPAAQQDTPSDIDLQPGEQPLPESATDAASQWTGSGGGGNFDLAWWVAGMAVPWVAVVGLLVLSGLWVDAALQVLLTQGMAFQDEAASTDEGKLLPLLDALVCSSPAPSVLLPLQDQLSCYHFMRVLCFKELDRVARTTLRCRVLFQSDTLLPPIFQHHLRVLRGFCDAAREIVGSQDRTSAQSSGSNGQGPTVLQGLLWGGGSDKAEVAALSRRLDSLLGSVDLHVACVSSLSALLTESQHTLRPDKHHALAAPIDSRGVCVRSLGPVLCQLLDCAVQCEGLVASDAYVPPALKVALRGNQMFRPPLAKFASALELGIYSIVVTFYMAIPDVLGQAGAECGGWVGWSERPQKTWKEQLLPRLQCYLAMASAVLPAGQPTVLLPAPNA